MKKIRIKKASGDLVGFDESKLIRSLQRSGASDEAITGIVDQVRSILYEGIPTREIYKTAFSLLRKRSRPAAARYKLKKAIYELGPSGFPFERFVGALLRHQGFEVQVGVMVSGHCVNHEVDVIADKGDQHFMVECKFHSDQGRFCNVKIPLYIHSRFRDIEKQRKKDPEHQKKFHQGWIFTNTRFTTDAIQYGSCTGMMLVGWDYPEKGSLKERIDASGLHPVTCLTTMTKHEKDALLEKDIVLCMDLCRSPGELKALGVADERFGRIMAEARALCEA